MGNGMFGEDDYIVAQFPPDFRGAMVDIGAADPEVRSNSLQLEEAGWTVLCVEPNPYYVPKLAARRKLVKPYAVSNFNGTSDFHVFKVGNVNWEACSALKPDSFMVSQHTLHSPEEVYQVEVRTLDYILAEVGLTRIDVLSIDVEGGENEVFQGFDLARWKPPLIILEQWDHADSYCKDLLLSHGYTFREKVGTVNYVYTLAARPT